MNIEILKHFSTFVVLCLVQALVLNHIHLFGCATPLLYVYFIMMFRRNYPKWAILVWSFAMGMSVDIFSNTPGVAAASATFIGMLQPYLLNLLTQRDSPDDLKPTMKTLGTSKFIYYTAICVILYNVVFFTVESFNFFNWMQWLKNIGGSSLLTIILILAIESVRQK